jgi:Lon protease-like protein
MRSTRETEPYHEHATRPGATDMTLPLFPLGSVLFPGGLLGLKVFEVRYLDLMGRCLREGSAFGVIALREGSEVHRAGGPAVALERCGVLAALVDVDVAQPGIMQVRCRGGQRFELQSSRQQDDGLWLGEVSLIEDDATVAPGEALAGSVRGLVDAIEALRGQGALPFLEPFRFDDAGWVANRWCELLPITLEAKQQLMRLGDPLVRLQLVDEYLRDKGVVG